MKAAAIRGAFKIILISKILSTNKTTKQTKTKTNKKTPMKIKEIRMMRMGWRKLAKPKQKLGDAEKVTV